ncbi:hypothetical protein C2857_002817 [Epichloe festucae Fl1]|uniref:Dol-P-Glc:Glc(2)Man(9)GlcNAc(2)-PP-Dol alpha-1,2-glucosyltransferase n=1 Tax=Epichloe festucae (strain Fl1) TaxID=877507 RepID=A0A7U3Q2X1_EPIFF|nr:hypothetical protein C2857_002817 [Epichloe festucae Fl1]
MAANIHFGTFSATSLAALSLSVPLLLFVSRGAKQPLRIFFSLSSVLLLSVAWFTLVSQTVPQPYLDEIFHIPQAQRYCEGKFLEWDDKITTPPGLYLFSILLQKAADITDQPWLFTCGASSLRFTNVLGLIVLASLALLCRMEIESRLHEAHSSARLKTASTYAIHTAANIALFPLLFFFSGLYYTDVISTAVVMGAFLNHLKRTGRDHSSWMSDVMTIVLGIATLIMRQTNVFWVVVWMGGLEAVHAIKTLRPERVNQPFMTSLGEQLKFYTWRYSMGDVHDPPLGLAWPDDMLFTAISFGIAALCNPARVMRQIWPYISVLITFAGFVLWNGGVVLGDKSNHVATIHVAQMLYIWPFFAFFSLPLLLPCAVPLLDAAIALFGIKNPPHAADSSNTPPPIGSPKKQSVYSEGRTVRNSDTGSLSRSSHDDSTPAKLSPALRIAFQIFNSSIPIWLLYLLATLAASVAVVQFNTIVHPFTLADNRHYMFYIFRYTIRRGHLVRFLLIIPYTLSRWMVWGTLAGCTDWTVSPRSASCSSRYGIFNPGPFTSHPFWIAYASQPRRTSVSYPRDMNSGAALPSSEADRQAQDLEEDDPLAFSSEPVSTSTGLVFLLTTALSLMTAPLVEPRYFIIPWVMWRLLVPAWSLQDHRPVNGSSDGISTQSFGGQLIAFSKRYDMRLILETTWLMAINVATGYIFLTKPYAWKDENGQVLDGGQLQRFMW